MARQKWIASSLSLLAKTGKGLPCDDACLSFHIQLSNSGEGAIPHSRGANRVRVLRCRVLWSKRAQGMPGARPHP
jgi:hypothetical protein